MITSPKGQNNASATTPDPQIKTTETQDNAQTEEDSKPRHYPRRERKPPEYLNDYITNSEDDSDHALTIVIKPHAIYQEPIEKQ